MTRSHRLVAVALCVASALTGCVAPRSLVALEKLKLEGEPYYMEHRRHECASAPAGFLGCYHSCGSTLWNVWRTSGSPQQKLEALDREMIGLGFERREDDDAKNRERDLWVLLYEPRQGAGVSIIAGSAYPDGTLSSGPPRRDRTALDGEFVYGVKASYQTPWDHLTGRWRNDTWTFAWLWSHCSQTIWWGTPRPRSQRR